MVGGLGDGLDGLGGSHVGAELRQVRHPGLLGEVDQGVLGVGRVALGVGGGVDGVVELPELSLLGGGPPGLGGQGRGLADLGQVAPLDAQCALLHQLVQLGLDILGELGAEGAGEVGVDDHDDRRVDLALGLAVGRVAVDLGVDELEGLLVGDRRGRYGLGDRGGRIGGGGGRLAGGGGLMAAGGDVLQQHCGEDGQDDGDDHEGDDRGAVGLRLRLRRRRRRRLNTHGSESVRGDRPRNTPDMADESTVRHSRLRPISAGPPTSRGAHEPLTARSRRSPKIIGPGGAVAHPPTHTLRPNLHIRPGAASFVKFWSK